MRFVGQPHKAMIFVGVLGIAASIFLSAVGFILANEYRAANEFSQFSKPGIHVFPVIGVKYTYLAAIFLIYVVFNWFKGASKCQFLVSLPLNFLMTVFAVMIIYDSRSMPDLGPAYAILTCLLDKGGVSILILPTVLFGLSGIAFFRLIQKKPFP